MQRSILRLTHKAWSFKLPVIPPISTEIDQHFGDPRWSSSIQEFHGEPKMLIDFPSWKSAINAATNKSEAFNKFVPVQGGS
jgi:hypothetical protein